MDEKKGLISVIVPVFNVKEYLERCVSSILCQTYKNIEVILVDDGSTDGTGELAEKIGTRDKRIKVIRKANGGVSSARNAGLEVATGEYIGFVDGDDYIEPDMYEFLHNLIIENNADIACCGTDHWFAYDENDRNKVVKTKIYTGYESVCLLIEEKIIIGSTCSKLYSKKTIGNTTFNTSIRHGEDFLFCFEVLLEANTVAVRNEGKYHYFVREDSCTNKKFNADRFGNLDNLDYIDAKYKFDGILNQLLKIRRIRINVYLLGGIASTGVEKEKYNIIRKDILKQKKFIFCKKNGFSIKFKIKVMLIWLFNPLFKILMKRRCS